jgi:FkbM family methyltransferase
MIYYSQSNQDKWVSEFYNNKTNGYFIEIGAYDGIQTSNTYFLEKNLNWVGICIEANPSIFTQLNENRKSVNLNVAVNNYKGVCSFNNDKITSDGQQIPCDTLNNIFKDNNVPKSIDYLSIDIEGYEYIILKDFNFNKYDIGMLTIEHNLYFEGPERKDNIFELLTNNGYTRVVDNALCLDTNPLYYNQPYEDWYINNKLL